MSHTIRFATLKDADAIIAFIDMHWKKGHALTHKPLFLYEYADRDKINFALGIDDQTGDIVGLCGYIRNSQNEHPDIWGSLWKALKTDNPVLGINILEFVKQQTGSRTFSSCGIAPKTIPIYDFLRYRTGKLQQFYRLGRHESYQIAVINDRTILDFDASFPVTVNTYDTFSGLQPFLQKVRTDAVPFKDDAYVEKRYFNHPFYSYLVLGLESSLGNGVLMAREIEQNGARILRMVDFIGQAQVLQTIGPIIDQMMEQKQYEYIDFYCAGVDQTVLHSAGFKLRDAQDSNIIPNYFEPFVRENTEIHYFTNTRQNICIFKADGDQDRPGIIPFI